MIKKGKVLIMCAAEDAERIISNMREHLLGKEASIIAEVQSLDESCCIFSPFYCNLVMC
jgi:hypothetical protein